MFDDEDKKIPFQNSDVLADKKTKKSCGFLAFLIFVLILTLGGYGWVKYTSVPCNTTLYYDIGEVDSDFKVSKAEFTQEVQKAEAMWESATGKNLFDLKPGAEFKVNLIYDSRQQKSDSINNKIDETEATVANYNALKVEYEGQVAQYERELAQYQADVNYWNSQGGASQAEYNRLETERTRLNNRAIQLRASSNSLNAMAKTLNLNISDINAEGGKTFEKGIYQGTEINIYEFQNNQELLITLAHEFGHAIDLGHISNESALMYYMIDKDKVNSKKITDEDLDALNQVCKINYFSFK